MNNDFDYYALSKDELMDLVKQFEEKVSTECWKVMKMPGRSSILLGEYQLIVITARAMLKYHDMKGKYVEVRVGDYLKYAHTINSLNDILNLNRNILTAEGASPALIVKEVA